MIDVINIVYMEYNWLIIWPCKRDQDSNSKFACVWKKISIQVINILIRYRYQLLTIGWRYFELIENELYEETFCFF